MFLNKIIIFIILSLVTYVVHAEPICTEAELTKDQLIEIIKNERQQRSDLPKAFPQSTYKVRRQGCHYVVIEYAEPRAIGNDFVFTLNQKGIIVDVFRGH